MAAQTVHPRWKENWSAGRIAFHRPAPHHELQRHLAAFAPAGRVLVPLAGKTVDLPFLAEQPGCRRVLGVEAVAQAVDEFVAEQPALALSPDESLGGPGLVRALTGGGVTMVEGDWFSCTPASLGGAFQHVWDRAALVAIDPAQRARYVEVLSGLLEPGGTVLLVAFDRAAGSEEARAAGPPFSLSEAQVRELFSGAAGFASVQKLSEHDVIADYQRFADAGVTSLLECVFLITKAD